LPDDDRTVVVPVLAGAVVTVSLAWKLPLVCR